MRGTSLAACSARALLCVVAGASSGCAPASPAARAGSSEVGAEGTDPTATSASSASVGPGGETASSSPTLSVVATLQGPARFARVDGRGFLLGEGPSIYDIAGDTLSYDRAKIRGMERRFDAYQAGELGVLAGRWPDETWLALNQQSAHLGSSVFRWSTDRWTEALKLDGYLRDGSPWLDGYSLLLEEAEDGRTRLLPMPSKGAPDVPGLVDAKGGCRIRGQRLAAFSDGQVVVQGVACEGERPQLAWFASDATQPKLAPLPDRDGELFGIHALAARSADAVYLGGWSGGDDAERASAGYLAKFDGKEILLWAIPDDQPVQALAVSPNGTLWAVTRTTKGDATLWRRQGSSFAKVSLPTHQGEKIDPYRVWAPADDDVWLVGEAVGGAVVLHSKPGTSVALPRTGASEYQSLRPPSKGCGVHLALVGKRAEPGSDYAVLRAALGEANHRVILMEFQRRGSIYLGVVAYSEKMARSLVKLVKKALPDTPTKVVCHEPRNRVRLFIFDPKSKQWRAERAPEADSN